MTERGHTYDDHGSTRMILIGYFELRPWLSASHVECPKLVYVWSMIRYAETVWYDTGSSMRPEVTIYFMGRNQTDVMNPKLGNRCRIFIARAVVIFERRALVRRKSAFELRRDLLRGVKRGDLGNGAEILARPNGSQEYISGQLDQGLASKHSFSYFSHHISAVILTNKNESTTSSSHASCTA